MDRHKGYYNDLLNSFSTEMSSYKKIMVHDIHRKGINFLCYFLLEMGFEEEQTFWIICYVFERLIPHNYLINMIPIIADIELLRMVLDRHVPELMRHLSSLNVDLNFILLPFFVTAFTSIKNFTAR